MLSKLKGIKKELLLIIITVIITVILVNGLKTVIRKVICSKESVSRFCLKKSVASLRIDYPQAVPLPSDFTSLTCTQVSDTYMRAWLEGSDLLGDSKAKVELSVSEEKLRKWKSYYRDKNGNVIDNSKVKKATVKLDFNFKDNKVTFSGDNLSRFENLPFEFDITLNNPYRLAGSIVSSKEEAPRFDVVGTFMIDRKTSFLILSNTSTMLSRYESFGSISMLFTCRKSN